MSVRSTDSEGVSALYDSVTGLAFGPVFSKDESASDFLEWYAGTFYSTGAIDLRSLHPKKLMEIVNEWHAKLHADQPEIPF